MTDIEQQRIALQLRLQILERVTTKMNIPEVRGEDDFISIQCLRLGEVLLIMIIPNVISARPVHTVSAVIQERDLRKLGHHSTGYTVVNQDDVRCFEILRHCLEARVPIFKVFDEFGAVPVERRGALRIICASLRIPCFDIEGTDQQIFDVIPALLILRPFSIPLDEPRDSTLDFNLWIKMQNLLITTNTTP